jgi:hypothetical protein
MIASILAAFGVGKIVDAYGLQATLRWLDVPAVWGFYSLFRRAFDRCLWALRPLRRIGLVTVPNLAGRWQGQGLSSYKGGGKEAQAFDVEVTIDQTWTKCRIHLTTATSQSNSLIGSILVEDRDRPSLNYEYRNEPRAHAGETMHAHLGVARLDVIDETHLEGEYYTGRDRREYGTLNLTKVG